MELIINDEVYQFCFGMGFLREINGSIKADVDGLKGVNKNIGLQYMVAGLLDGDVETLVGVLDAANKGQTPRLTKKQIDAYIDDEVDDLDALFDQVVDFLSRTNATKKTTVWVREQVEKAAEKNV
ncbi:MAG: tail assembly chaperone [Clostridiales bacterium]